MTDFLIVLGVLAGLLVAWQAVELARASRLKKRLAEAHGHDPQAHLRMPGVRDGRRTTGARHSSRY